MDSKDLILKIREGEIDCNNQSLFFSILIKGLMNRLDDDISIRNIQIPHIILHTGDDLMYLNVKGQNQSIEPYEVSNEDYVYNIIPRCIVNPNNIDLVPDQVTNPYSRGNFQIQTEDSIYTFSAEFRRMPIKLSVDLKYYVNTYKELLELVQQILSKLAFIRTYNITYMGQLIKCSYKIPDNFQGEHLMELDGTTQDNRSKTLSLSLEVEANFPIFSNKTVVSTDHYISNITTNLRPNKTIEDYKYDKGFLKSHPELEGYDDLKVSNTAKVLLYRKDGINNNEAPIDIINPR